MSDLPGRFHRWIPAETAKVVLEGPNENGDPYGA
jgi:hypothetical protein